jgi:hypothetical protein
VWVWKRARLLWGRLQRLVGEVRGRRKAHSFIAPCKRVKVQNNELFFGRT